MLSLFAIYYNTKQLVYVSDLSTIFFATVCTVPININACLIALAVNMKTNYVIKTGFG